MNPKRRVQHTSRAAPPLCVNRLHQEKYGRREEKFQFLERGNGWAVRPARALWSKAGRLGSVGRKVCLTNVLDAILGFIF